MDSIPDWLSILLIVILVMLSAFFNASETSFACLNRYKYMAEADEGKRSSKLILRLSDKFESTLITTLIGNNVGSILVSTLSTFLFLHLFNGAIPDATVSLIASIVMAFIFFLFADTLPKFIGKNIPDVIVRVNCYPLFVIYILFFPLVQLFRGLNHLFRKAFKAKPEPALTEEDFSSLIDEAEEKGIFEENESEIIQNTLDFADTSVKEVFTPLVKMKMLDSDKLTGEKLRAYIQTCPYSRIPIYFKNKDKVVGILVVKNYLSAYFKNPSVNYLEFVQRPYFVTPRVHLDDLVDGYKEHHTQIAIVRYQGKVLGMVTMEDVLEELVGSIGETSKARVRR